MIPFKKFLNFSKIDLVRQIFLSNFITPVFPYKVTFALTYRCNLKCKYCRTWARIKKKELNLYQIKLILNSMKNVRWLQFTGGEIFTREDIEEIFDIVIKNRNVAVLTFPTNGVYTAKIVRSVKSLSNKLKGTKVIITCSIDGEEDTHDRLRGVEGAYNKCVETFRQLQNIDGVDVYFGVTVNRDNYKNIPALLAALSAQVPNFTFDKVHFNFAGYSFFYNNYHDNVPNKLVDEEIYSYVNELREKYKQKGIKALLENYYFMGMRRYLKNSKTPFKCMALQGTCFIDAFGDVYPCTHYQMKVGNLHSSEYNFKKFWKLCLRKKEVIKLIKTDKCPKCWTPCEAYPAILSNLLKI